VTDLSDELLASPAVGDIAAAAADRDAVGRGLARLDPDQRIVLVLRYYRDLPVDEIAARVGSSPMAPRSSMGSSRPCPDVGWAPGAT
jgi:DNA-directed RNA polymerase specialized sigma24 family protein